MVVDQNGVVVVVFVVVAWGRDFINGTTVMEAALFALPSVVCRLVQKNSTNCFLCTTVPNSYGEARKNKAPHFSVEE
jgi:hypothetical protein